MDNSSSIPEEDPRLVDIAGVRTGDVDLCPPPILPAVPWLTLWCLWGSMTGLLFELWLLLLELCWLGLEFLVLVPW